MRDMIVSVYVSIPVLKRRKGAGIYTWRMHHTAHDETTRRATRQMQRRTFLHAQMLHQSPLREEVRRELHGAAKASAHHRGAHAAVEALDALASVDLPEAIHRILVVVLCAHGQRGRIALQPRLDEEERAAGHGAHEARRRAREDVDAEGLHGCVAIDQGCERASHGLVEAQTAAVQQDLVDVGCADTAVDAPDSLVADDHRDAVDGPPVELWLVSFVLEFSLQLHARGRVSAVEVLWDLGRTGS